MVALRAIERDDAQPVGTPPKRVPHAPTTEIAEAERPLLERIRRAAARCRVARHIDLFGACACLSHGAARSAPAFADALLRTLAEAFGRHVRIYAPGSREVSFDEAWLVSLLRAQARDDTPSVTFLLHARVAPDARRCVGFLSAGVAERLESF